MADMTKVFYTYLKSFDVDAYADARDFGAEEWSIELGRRHHLLTMIQDPLPTSNPLEFLGSILANPLRSRGVADDIAGQRSVIDLSVYAAWCMKELIESNPTAARVCTDESEGPAPINSAHARESAEWWDEVFEQMRQERDSPDSNLLHSSFNELLVNGPFESDTAYAEVNLSAPDDIIIDDFKAWLGGIRKNRKFEHSPVKRFTPKELARWAQNRVLPYLDLFLASKILAVSVPNHVFGEVIFGGMDFDVAEKIRKTVAPLATELMDFDLLEALKFAARAAVKPEPEEIT